MKKINTFLGTLFLLSITLNLNGQELNSWVIEKGVGEFGELTEELILTCYINGKFSNTTTTNFLLQGIMKKNRSP